jgi:hypothetical protein
MELSQKQGFKYKGYSVSDTQLKNITALQRTAIV